MLNFTAMHYTKRQQDHKDCPFLIAVQHLSLPGKRQNIVESIAHLETTIGKSTYNVIE